MKSIGLYMGWLALLAAIPCVAQQPQDANGTPSNSAGKPDTTAPVAKPVTPSDKPAPESKKPKKVWTNEDMSSVKGTVSVVGDAKRSVRPQDDNGEQIDYANRDSDEQDAKQQQIDNYKNQIADLRAQIDAIDKRIEQLKNFKAENTAPSGGININKGYNMVPREDQVKQLEDKKKQLQAKIEDVENEARKNGIDSGDLR